MLSKRLTVFSDNMHFLLHIPKYNILWNTLIIKIKFWIRSLRGITYKYLNLRWANESGIGISQ